MAQDARVAEKDSTLLGFGGHLLAIGNTTEVIAVELINSQLYRVPICRPFCSIPQCNGHDKWSISTTGEL
eukprot:5624253-Amphidinium_carterae.3